MRGVPSGWTQASIEQLAGVEGLTTDGDWIESKDQDPNGAVRLIQLADIGDGEFRDRSARFVTPDTVHRLNCTLLEQGDLLIARMPDPIGRACIFPGLGQSAITAVDVFVWRASPGGPLARWLMHFVNSKDVRSTIESEAGGTTRQRIAGGRLKQLDIPVPPLNEQRRIVTKIDSVAAKSRRARGQLDRIPRLVERYKQAILTTAFQGELTRNFRGNSRLDWPTIEPSGLFKWSSGKNLPAKGQAKGHIPVIGGNGISGYHNTALIDFPTLVVGRVGAQCGNVHRSDGPAWITDNAIFAKFVSPGVDLDFAVYFFRAADLNSLAGGTGQPYINQSTLNSLVMPLPAIEEQREIVRLIKSALEWIERLSSESTSARKMIDRLDQAILAKAFRGELVPQDPNDEPASALLDRIRTQKNSAPKAKHEARGASRISA